MKAFILISIVLSLQSWVNEGLLAHEPPADSSPRSGLPNVLVSFNAELGEQVELFVGFDALPSPNSANSGISNEMWMVVVDRSGEPLHCSGYLPCSNRIKLKLPPSGFLKLVMQPIQPFGTDYILRVAGTLGPSTSVVIGDLSADSLGRVDFIVSFSFTLSGENEVPPVQSVQEPAHVGRLLIRGSVVGPDGGTKAQTIDVNQNVYVNRDFFSY